jgi:hypothetical protein
MMVWRGWLVNVESFSGMLYDGGFTVISFVHLFVLCCHTSAMKPTASLLDNESEDLGVTALINGR